MEKKKINSLNIILLIIVLLLIIVPATMYIIKNHYDSMYLVINKKIVEQANVCYNDGNCTNKKITMKELIEKNYIEKMYDPISKELINLDSYVNLDNNEFIIVK